MRTERVEISGVPHWLYEDGTILPVIAGGQFPVEGLGGPSGTGVLGGGLTVEPVPGLPGALQIFINGEPAKDDNGNFMIVGASDFLEATQQFAPPAPPAFAGTREGLVFQARLDKEAAADLAATTKEITRLETEAAARRLTVQEEGLLQRLKIQEAGLLRRTRLTEAGAGARAQLGEAGAFRRSLLGEVGAGARSELEQATQRRGQSITAALDTFRNLGELTSRPSDFVRLAFNASGIQPPGETPTDVLTARQREFFQNQVGAAGATPKTFADLFTRAREGVGGFGAAPSFADILRQAQGAVGSFQFGGRPQEESGVTEMRRPEKAAIVGEGKRPELVFGATEVIPNLTPSELRLLREGGVGGLQFGSDGTPNVFDFPSLRKGTGDQPLFTGGFRRAAAGGVGAVTRAEAISPLDFSIQRFSSLLPFEQQLALGRFGETIVDPNDPNRIQRAGIDPQTALEIIRRASLTGRAPSTSRFG